MIEQTNGYKVGEQCFLTLIDAQKYELNLLAPTGIMAGAFPNFVMDNKDKIIDILTTTPKSKAKTRKFNGGRKKINAQKILITASPTGTVPTIGDLVFK